MTRHCPRCGAVLARTVDDNSGILRFRCEPCDVEECPDCSQWTAYDDARGWYHLEVGARPCFLHPREEPAPAVGDTVRALYPNARYGEAVVTRVSADPREKPYVVARADGTVAYFHPDQIERIVR